MSTDWGIGCVDCARTWRSAQKYASDDQWRYFTGEYDNCRDIDALWRLIRARKEIVAVDAVLGARAGFFWTDEHRGMGFSTETGIAGFMRDHEGHELRPMNEYGDFENCCYLRFDCGDCGTTLRCTLDDKHEGPCRREP